MKSLLTHSPHFVILPGRNDGSRSGILAPRKWLSCNLDKVPTMGNCPGKVTLNQYLIQMQRLQVLKPNVKSLGAIVSRAGFAGFLIIGDQLQLRELPKHPK